MLYNVRFAGERVIPTAVVSAPDGNIDDDGDGDGSHEPLRGGEWKHVQYSKFRDTSNAVEGWRSKKLPGRVGMLSIYTPTLAFFAFGFVGVSKRTFLLSSSVSLHFLKRDLEVLFLHKYSGYMILDAVMNIAFHYFLLAICIIYGQHLTIGMSEPSVDFKYIGLFLFLAGMVGNFYHHYLLSKLRENSDKEYKIQNAGYHHQNSGHLYSI